MYDLKHSPPFQRGGLVNVQYFCISTRILAHNLIGWFEIILYWASLLQAALFITTLQTYLANLQFAEAQQVISKAYPYGVRITTDVFEHETILSS